MADDDSTTDPVDPAETAPVDDKTTPEKPMPAPSESESQVKKANREAAALRVKLQAFEDRDKTEAQKLTDRADAAEKRVATLEMNALRSKVASDNGLPADLVDRLRGDTAEALDEDAKNLTALLKASRGAGDVDQGVRGGGTAGPAQLKQADLQGMSPSQIVKAQAEGLCNDLLGIKR